jgi:hypothetical protein
LRRGAKHVPAFALRCRDQRWLRIDGGCVAHGFKEGDVLISVRVTVALLQRDFMPLREIDYGLGFAGAPERHPVDRACKLAVAHHHARA